MTSNCSGAVLVPAPSKSTVPRTLNPAAFVVLPSRLPLTSIVLAAASGQPPRPFKGQLPLEVKCGGAVQTLTLP